MLLSLTFLGRQRKFANFPNVKGGACNWTGNCRRPNTNSLSSRYIHQTYSLPSPSLNLTGCGRVACFRRLAISPRTAAATKQTLVTSLVSHKYRSYSYFTSRGKVGTNNASFGAAVVQKLSSCDNISIMNTSKVISKTMSTVVPPPTEGNGVPSEPRTNSPLADPRGIKQIKINACGELYEVLSKTKPYLYGSAPKGCGIDFNLTYYDSMELLKPKEREKAPIVCMLHGAPGSFSDFDSAIHFLTSKGVRIVVPNFPPYSETYEHSFRHSPSERADYLLNFFQTIGVQEIDLLVGHSSAIYTVFELLNQMLNSTKTTGKHLGDKLKVKSIGLFSTPTYNLPQNMAKTPFRLFALKLFDYPFLRPIILATIGTFAKFVGIRNRVDTKQIDDFLIAASAIGYSDYDRLENDIKLIHQFKIPTFVLFGCNDRLIPMRYFDQLKRDLEVDREGQVKHYDKEGKLVDESNKQTIASDKLVLVSEFETGGHYVFQRYSSQVNEDIYGFLKAKVMKHNDDVDNDQENVDLNNS